MTRHFIDRFQYYRDEYLKAMLKGDQSRQRLWETYDAAHPHFDDNKEYALSLLEQGASLARSLHEPCWELLFEFWMYEVDIMAPDRLERIIKLFVKANKLYYRECTLLGDIYASLLRAYLWYDPLSYEGEIREGIDYVLDSLPLPQDTYIIVLWTQMQLMLEVGEYERILSIAKTYFRYCEKQDVHQAWGYSILLQAYYHLGETQLALETAHDLEQASQRGDNESLVFTALKWQYTILHKLGDDHEMQQVAYAMNTFDLGSLSGYDALHEAQYEYDRMALGWFGKLALMREAEFRIEGAINAKRPYLECKTRLRRLAALMSLPWLIRWIVRLFLRYPSAETQFAETRTAAEQLLKPQPMLAWINRVEHGDYEGL